MRKNPLLQGANESTLVEKIVSLDEQLTSAAFEGFIEHGVSSEQLKQFYRALRDFSRAAEKVLDVMHKTGIDG